MSIAVPTKLEKELEKMFTRRTMCCSVSALACFFGIFFFNFSYSRGTNEMAKTDSVEYRTIQNCTEKLVLFLKKLMRDLAVFLLQKGFILPVKYEEVSSSKLTDNENADILLSCIRNEIKISSNIYHMYMYWLLV